MSKQLIPEHLGTDCPSANSPNPSPVKREPAGSKQVASFFGKRPRPNDEIDEADENPMYSRVKVSSSPSKPGTQPSPSKRTKRTQAGVCQPEPNDRLRPKSLADFVGQEHLLDPTTPFITLVRNRSSQNIILWGPPGSGELLYNSS